MANIIIDGEATYVPLSGERESEVVTSNKGEGWRETVQSLPDEYRKVLVWEDGGRGSVGYWTLTRVVEYGRETFERSVSKKEYEVLDEGEIQFNTSTEGDEWLATPPDGFRPR